MKKQKPLVTLLLIGAIVGIYLLARPSLSNESKQSGVDKARNLTTTVAPTKDLSIEDGIHKDDPHLHAVIIIIHETLTTPGLQQSRSFLPETTLLEALERDFKIKKTGEGKNAYITEINGVAASDKDKTFWGFYVNSKKSEVGAGSYILQDGDVIEWRLEKY